MYDGILWHNALSDPAIQAIVDQRKKHPILVKIITPIVTPVDFKFDFKYVAKETSSSQSGWGVQHYKACAEWSKDGCADIMCEFYAVLMTAPLETGYCLEKWKQPTYFMLEKIPRVSRSDKVQIIQLLEAGLNQVLRVAFTYNISNELHLD
jgi:hypothetical protein